MKKLLLFYFFLNLLSLTNVFSQVNKINFGTTTGYFICNPHRGQPRWPKLPVCRTVLQVCSVVLGF